MTQHSAAILVSKEDHVVWCGDFNHHHLLWDEEQNKHLFTVSVVAAAQMLTTLLEDYNMVMLLLKVCLHCSRCPLRIGPELTMSLRWPTWRAQLWIVTQN